MRLGLSTENKTWEFEAKTCMGLLGIGELGTPIDGEGGLWHGGSLLTHQESCQGLGRWVREQRYSRCVQAVDSTAQTRSQSLLGGCGQDADRAGGTLGHVTIWTGYQTGHRFPHL